MARAAKLPPPPSHWPETFPEPEPSKYCPDHPNDTTDKCDPCRTARQAEPEAKAAWEQRQQEFNTARTAARRNWIDTCRQCDNEHGDMLGPDGTVLDDTVRCKHPRLLQAYAARPDAFTIPSRKAAS